jgi:hypothetical protein
MKKVYFIFISLTILSCSRTEIPFGSTENCDPELNYTDNIAEIINSSCAYSGCHLNSAPGIYTSYEGLKGSIDNGEFFTRVLSIRDMPPSYAPDDKPQELSAEEIELINCWAENDYPK